MAELERLRCGCVDPPHDVNTAATAAVLEAAAANLQAQGNSVVVQQETAGEGFSVALEGRKEVREIEFFPTRISSHSGGPDESVLRRASPLSSSPPGGGSGSLDLSLKL
ncbi:hypothetical protein VPH35_003860 [Triticum aestivum]